MKKLGEFELLVLLSILRQEESAYANRVREDLDRNAGRRVTRGALYRTLDRLTEKGFLEWDLEPSETPEGGGHPMRRLRVTEGGLGAVRQARDVLVSFFDGVEAVLDEA
jgi:DNA-binding PadR family transcriptional regulator